MPTSGNHEKVSESAEKLKYWEVKNLTDTKKFKELNADKWVDLHYESTSKTMKLDFYLWKSKVDSNYYLKYHEVKYSNPNPYQSDPVTYTQSIPPENVKKEHLLKINTTDDFIKSLKTALDSYYRGARPKTGEDEKLWKIIYEKMGISKDKEQKKEKEKKLALTSFAEEEKILQDNVNNLYA